MGYVALIVMLGLRSVFNCSCLFKSKWLFALCNLYFMSHFNAFMRCCCQLNALLCCLLVSWAYFDNHSTCSCVSSRLSSCVCLVLSYIFLVSNHPLWSTMHRPRCECCCCQCCCTRSHLDKQHASSVQHCCECCCCECCN